MSGKRTDASPIRARLHKYGAQRTEIDGIVFHSKKEAKRYGELKMLEKAGKIHGLVCQPAYDLHAFGSSVQRGRLGRYVADFAYMDNTGQGIVEDVKGFDTPLSKWKRKHTEAQYGITIAII